MISSGKLTAYLNDLLCVRDFSESAINGLQVQGRKKVQKIAFAVDGVLESFEQAARWGADYIIVHHGLFWGRPYPLRGADYRRIKCLMDHEIALYACHLPLDAHLVFGHAACLLNKLDIQGECEAFGRYGEQTIGAMARIKEQSLHDFTDSLRTLFPSGIQTLEFGSDKIRTVACVTGQGADFSLLKEAKIKNIDFYISGETTHPSYHYAREQGINLALCGHYQTETFGLKALMEHIQQKFQAETRFFDIPTGF